MRRAMVGACALLLVAITPTVAHATQVSDSPKTSASFNDAVHAVVHHGGVVYAGGDFTAAHQDGARSERSHLAAVGTDGRLLPFAPELDGPVYAVETDGSHLYVAGRFSRIDGVPVTRVARIDLDSATVDEDFTVSIAGTPRALELVDDRLYVGGDFNSVGGQERAKVAAVDKTDGTLVEGFAPRFDRGVRVIAAAANRLYVGGGFTKVGDTAARKLVALTADGAVDSGFTPETKGAVFDVAVEGDRVYTAAGGPGGRVQTYDLGGTTVWERTADGDVVSVTVHDGLVYAGGHFDKVCRGTEVGPDGKCLEGVYADRGKLFALGADNALLDWNPDADSVIGAMVVESAGDAVVAAGTFLTFAGGTIPQRAFALFSTG